MKIHKSLLSLILLLLIADNTLAASIAVPKFKSKHLDGPVVKIVANSTLVIPSNLKSRFMDSVNSFESNLKSLPNTTNNLIIEFQVRPQVMELPENVSKKLENRESYYIKVTDKRIDIIGADQLGLLHGMTTLDYLLKKNRGELREGYILDWPDLKVRAIHLPTNIDSQKMIALIKIARYGHYNTLILSIHRGIRISSMQKIVKDNAWSKEEFLEVVRIARENGLDVIPELRLLTHQNVYRFRDVYPELMFNRVTYDPRKEEVYSVFLPVIDEIINLIKPEAIHIGHDEVAGYNQRSIDKWLRPGERMLPPELFLMDIERLYEHLKSRGVNTWIWGDMLLAPEEFPTMKVGNLHGSNGYAALRTKIPRDIIVCDWHYYDKQTDFPSALAFAKQGNRVLGATWKRKETIINFSRYVKNLPTNGEGMIATVWGLALKEEMGPLLEVMEYSAWAFWNTTERLTE